MHQKRVEPFPLEVQETRKSSIPHRTISFLEDPTKVGSWNKTFGKLTEGIPGPGFILCPFTSFYWRAACSLLSGAMNTIFNLSGLMAHSCAVMWKGKPRTSAAMCAYITQDPKLWDQGLSASSVLPPRLSNPELAQRAAIAVQGKRLPSENLIITLMKPISLNFIHRWRDTPGQIANKYNDKGTPYGLDPRLRTIKYFKLLLYAKAIHPTVHRFHIPAPYALVDICRGKYVSPRWPQTAGWFPHDNPAGNPFLICDIWSDHAEAQFPIYTLSVASTVLDDYSLRSLRDCRLRCKPNNNMNLCREHHRVKRSGPRTFLVPSLSNCIY